MAVLKKVTLHYPAFINKNKKSGKFQVNLGNLTDAHVKQLVDDLGIDEDQIKEPKTKFKGGDEDGKKQEAADAQGRYIVVRSNYSTKVVGGKQIPLSEDIIKSIGNGSVANVQINSYPWTWEGERGVSGGLQQVMLLMKETFVGFSSEFDDEDDELDTSSTGKDMDNEFDDIEEMDID